MKPAADLTVRQAILALLKVSTGVGSFTVSKSFLDVGLFISVPLTVVISGMTVITIFMLIKSEELAKELKKRQMGGGAAYVKLNEEEQVAEERFLYEQIAAIAFPYPPYLARILISACITLSIIGICATYLDFLSSIGQMLIYVSLNRWVSRFKLCWLIFPVESFLCSLENYKSLRFTTILGSFAVVFACFVVIIVGFASDNIPHPSVEKLMSNSENLINPSGISSFLSSALFVFAVHIVAVPILQSQQDKSLIKNSLVIAYSALATFNIVFGILGILAFENCQENILSSLPSGNLLNLVQVLLCLDLLLTFPLVLAVARGIVEPPVMLFFSEQFHLQTREIIDAGIENETLTQKLKCTQHPFLTQFLKYIVRAFLVLLCVLLAVLIPKISDMVSLSGGIVCATLGYVVPPLFYCTLLKKLHGNVHFCSVLLPCSFIFMFGIFSVISNVTAYYY